MEPTDPAIPLSTVPPRQTEVRTRMQTDRPSGAAAEVAVLRLLHVEDNPSDAVLMQEYIREACRQWDLSLARTSMSILHPEPLVLDFDTAECLVDVTFDRVEAADCAILDLSLPDASGLEALVALRRMSVDLPIVVLTGFDDLEVGLAALRAGADDYLVKSQVDGSSLSRAVRYAIARRALSLELAAETAQATVAAATRIMERAGISADGLEPEGSGAYGGAPGVGGRIRPWDVAAGTHQVTVQVDRVTGEYVLTCQSCDWQAVRGPGELHSWSDRALDSVLLQHVTFGDPRHEKPPAASPRR